MIEINKGEIAMLLYLTFTLLQAAFVLGVGAWITMLLFLAKHPAPADWPRDPFARFPSPQGEGVVATRSGVTTGGVAAHRSPFVVGIPPRPSCCA